MISLLTKISRVLKPFHKLTYLLALLVIVYLLYQLLFLADSSKEGDKGAMLSLLALSWLALINLMLHIFAQTPEKQQIKQTLIIRMKAKLNQGLYYMLSLVFIGVFIALIVLSFKMLRI